MRLNQRKMLFGVPFAAVATFLALSASAYACTLFYGTLTVEGNGQGRVTTVGLRNGMLQRVSKGITTATASGGSVSISTGVDGCCNKLPAKTYNVGFNNFVYSDHRHWQNDCMVVGENGTVGLGTIGVGSAGTIIMKDGAPTTQPVQFPLPDGLTPNTAPAEAGICIVDTFRNYGNFAPVTIV